MIYQIEAPEGFQCLSRGERYILIRNRTGEPVSFLHFNAKRNGRLLRMNQKDFQDGLAADQDGLTQKRIVRVEPKKLPQWLHFLETTDLDGEDAFMEDIGRRGYTHREHVEQRIAYISDALAKVDEILSADDPDRELNRLARRCNPPQNERRFRNWFYLYIGYGYEKWALLPASFESGRWDRTDAKHANTKFGRPAERGRHAGYPCDKDMVEAIAKGFEAHAHVGGTLKQAYSDTVTKTFKCKARSGEKHTEFYHPQGKPFPSYFQFRYHCLKAFTYDGVQRALKGEHYHRQKVAASMGSFASELVNLNERTHTDVRYSKELPRCNRETQPQRLAIAEIFCGLSKFGVGIGFSTTGENRQAYASALFCMAIPKSRFGKIIGLKIDDKDWPGHGLPASVVSDRGPGASWNIDLPESVTREMTPSFTPQDNAVAEAKHQRKSTLPGAPTYVQSDLSAVQMARLEVLKFIEQNRSSSAAESLSPEMIAAGVSTPYGMWRHLDDRMRNDVMQVPFEEAVRRLLTKVEFKIDKGRLMFHKFAYSSVALQQTKFFAALRRHKEGTVPGYVLDIAPRTAWIEADGRLIEVEVVLPFRTSAAEYWFTLPELTALGQAKASNEYDRKQAVPASSALPDQQFEEQTGMSAARGTVHAGRPRNSSKTSASYTRKQGVAHE